ncbi:GNAT family N-acetyltransferase [Verrucomicrobiota bacterium sgz303538]
MSIRIRAERSSDIAAIEALTIAAFQTAAHTSHTEHFIIRALRESGQLSVSLVAEDDGSVIGHVAASPVMISDGAANWYGLGPISVTPERQGQGIGSQLMSHVLSELRALGAAGCVLLGDPGYYCRFGFTVEPSLVLSDVPPEYFQAVSFDSSMPSGTVTYHDSFSAEG